MAWKFNADSPIYLQIMEEIKLRIAKGVLKPGDKVPPVRDLAITAGVNPNTMQKALSELEREGVLYSQRTAGRFVSEQHQSGIDMKVDMRDKLIKTYITGMRELEYGNQDILNWTKDYLDKEGER